MKSLTLLIFAVGCTSAFGQAMSTASNSNGFREYASNAVAVAYMSPVETGDSKAPAVAQDFESISTQPNNQDSEDLSVASIQAILEKRLAMANAASSETVEVNKTL